MQLSTFWSVPRWIILWCIVFTSTSAQRILWQRSYPEIPCCWYDPKLAQPADGAYVLLNYNLSVIEPTGALRWTHVITPSHIPQRFSFDDDSVVVVGTNVYTDGDTINLLAMRYYRVSPKGDSFLRVNGSRLWCYRYDARSGRLLDSATSNADTSWDVSNVLTHSYKCDQLRNGDFLVYGSYGLFNLNRVPPERAMHYLMRYSKNLDTLWFKFVKSASECTQNFDIFFDELPSGKLIMAGNCKYSYQGKLYRKEYILILSPEGELQRRILFEDTTMSSLTALKVEPHGTIIIAAVHVTQQDGYWTQLYRIDTTGRVLATARLSPWGYPWRSYAAVVDMINTDDGGLLLVGTERMYERSVGEDRERWAIVRVDSTLHQLWILTNEVYNTSVLPWTLSKILRTSGGTYLAVGYAFPPPEIDRQGYFFIELEDAATGSTTEDRAGGTTPWPTPASEEAVIALPAELQSGPVRVYLWSTTGTRVEVPWSMVGSERVWMDLRGVASGVYMVELRAGNTRRSVPLVVWR